MNEIIHALLGKVNGGTVTYLFNNMMSQVCIRK